MKTKSLWLILIALIFSCCTKEDTDLRLPDFNTPTITGYYQRDLGGILIGIVGEPNVKLMNGIDYKNSQYYLYFFPNPVQETCFITLSAPQYGENMKVWITPADINNQISDRSVVINNAGNLTVGGFPVYQTELPSVSSMSIHLRNLPDGYYRIYLKVNDYLLYDNLVIYNPK